MTLFFTRPAVARHWRNPRDRVSLSAVNLPDSLRKFGAVPLLTPRRILLATLVAMATDGLQAWMSPLAMTGADGLIDVAAMLLLTRLLGFHILLLPSFLVEMLPVAGLLPTWTGCALAVIALRKREQNYQEPAPGPGPDPQ